MTQASPIHAITLEEIEAMKDATEQGRVTRMISKEVAAHKKDLEKQAGKRLQAAKAWGMSYQDFDALVKKLAARSELETLLVREVNVERAGGVTENDLIAQKAAREEAEAIEEAKAMNGVAH